MIEESSINKNSEGDEESRIKLLLKQQPLGMNIKELSAALGMSRNSVAKYLDVLTAAGHLEVRQIGNAKLYYLSRRVPVAHILNLSHEMILILDENLKIVRANDSFIGFVDLPRAQILGERLSGLPLPLLSVKEEEELTALIRGGPSWKKEIRLLNQDREIFLTSRFIPTIFEGGSFGIAVMLEDISEKILAESAAKENEWIFHTIFQGSQIPKFFINTNHKVVMWDRALEIMTRIKVEEVLGTNRQWRAFYPDERPCLADLLVDMNLERIEQEYQGKCRKMSTIDNTYEVTEFFPTLGPDGKWFRLTASVVRDSHGNLMGAMETIEDITGHKRKEFRVEEGTGSTFP
jgi:PAS domain-containing protein